MKQQYKISDPLSGIKGYRTKLYDKFGFKNYNSVGTYLMINAIKIIYLQKLIIIFLKGMIFHDLETV